MLSFLLKFITIAWFAFIIFLLAILNLGRTAPEISKIAFFTQEFDSTDYWRLDLLTGVAFKDEYSSSFLINILDNVKNVPLRHIITIIQDANMNRIYEVNLNSRELRHIGDYPATAHYAILAGDYIFPIDYANGSYDWTRIHISSRRSDFFLEDTYMISSRVSPDSRWLAGSVSGGEHLFINMLDASRYHIYGYCCIAWSPDGTWYIATHSSREYVSVLNADTGEHHPLLPLRFSARNAYWTRDSQAILFQNEGHLSSISLLTGAIEQYPVTGGNFWTACLSPSQRYILTSSDSQLSLIDIETGQEFWRLNHNFRRASNCFWSDDSRYLALHVVTDAIDNSGSRPVMRSNWQGYFLIDIVNQRYSELSPENLPTLPIYMHIPD
jgi:WD40 repeat protein